MYNKIAQIILNSAKLNGANIVYISQPDALKEKLAGKIFLLASLETKKNNEQKIIDFIISSIEDYYYNDEKILLRDKIEGLKIENIFEAALAKTNIAVSEFLQEEKTQLDSMSTSITLGVIYENKLHFANYGNNKALLLFPKNNVYELINIEANAKDDDYRSDEHSSSSPKLFSSIISGDIPKKSYFVFSNETLPEYISNKDLIEIITKLPPIVAVEQIKNILEKTNSYVPFLGIIIKNTIDNFESSQAKINITSAQASISALNNTEDRTERMLSPSGLIDLRKIVKKSKNIISKFNTLVPQKNIKQDLKKEEKNKIISLKSKEQKLNIPRKDSFLIKDKIFFKKNPKHIYSSFKRYIINTPLILQGLSHRIKSLNGKNKFLFSILIIFIILFSSVIIITSINRHHQEEQKQFNNLVSQIEKKEGLIDSHLLYNDDDGARIVLMDAQALLHSLPNKKKSQQEEYNRLNEILKSQEDKIQKIVIIDNPKEMINFQDLSVENITLADKGLYYSDGSNSYKADDDLKPGQKIKLGADNLSYPYYSDGKIYYWNRDKKIVELNTKTNKVTQLDIDKIDSGIRNFSIFNNNLYLLNDSKNQIQRYKRSGNKYVNAIDWIKDKTELKQAIDFGIDGHIYVLDKNGNIKHLFKGSNQKYKNNVISPAISLANKLIVGNTHLYVLDSSSQRIIVFLKKDGSLVKQYKIPSLTNIKDFSVDEKQLFIYILNNNKLYKIKLDI